MDNGIIKAQAQNRNGDKRLLSKIYNLLIYIQNARLGSLCGINTHYLPQVNKEIIDDLCKDVHNALEK